MYFNGHAHTMYSNLRLLDSINKPKTLIDAAIKMGLSGIAITDHECLGAHMEVNQYAKKLQETNPDFTIALGNEIYLVDERTSKIKYHHFILLAKNAIGHKALNELSTTAWYSTYTDRMMQRVPLTKEELSSIMEKYKGSIIATTACLAGELPSLILDLTVAEENRDRALVKELKEKINDFMLYCLSVFGDDFYLEVAPAETPEQVIVNKRILPIAKAYGIKITVATDAHYVTEKDLYVHSAYLKSKDGERETESFYKYARLMTQDEVRKYLKLCFDDATIDGIFETTEEIRKKIEFYSLERTQIIPVIPLQEYPKVDRIDLIKYPTLKELMYSDSIQEKYWANRCLNSLKKVANKTDEYYERLELEAKLIKDIGNNLGQCLFAYFNTFEHYINIFWECGSIVGPGRGSASGFLSNYLLGITQLDPIKWKLPYWRFLNEARVELPDIDIDLSPSKRPEILKAIRAERGEFGIIQVCTYGTEGTKNAILTACRGYRSEGYPNGIDVDTAQYLSSLVPVYRGFLWPFKDILEGNEEEDRLPVNTFINEVNKYPGLLEVMIGIEGLVNKRSSHAAGVIFYDDDPFETSAFMRTPSGDLVTQFDLHMAEAAGDTKYDFLVTDVLDKMTQCLELLQEDGVIEKDSLKNLYDKYLHPDNLDISSPKIWKALAEGSVLDTFQFSTGVGLQVAKKIKPQNPLEMTAANALMRLMSERGQESQQDRFARIKEDGLESFTKEMIINRLTDEQQEVMHRHCDPYYGCVPLQEQMMEILRDEEIAGFSLADANNARKVVAKKLMSKIPELKEQLYTNVPDKNFADYIWRTAVQPSLGYAFSINHSLPYSFVGLQTLYLGTHFNPIYWNTACLIVNSGSINIEGSSTAAYDKIAKAIGDIRSTGMEVSLVDINKSSFGFKPDAENNVILFGLKGVINIGDDLIRNIIANRPYTSMVDFMTRVSLDKTSMISLIKGGAFDKFGSRYLNMGMFLWHTCGKKKNLTIANVNELVDLNLIPKELDRESRIYKFTRFLRKNKNNDVYFQLDPYCIDFLNKYNIDISIDADSRINIKSWESIYNKEMDAIRSWLSDNKAALIKKINTRVFKDEWDKYAEGNLSRWEMESLCFYYHDHELINLNYDKYNLVDFFSLPEEPTIRSSFFTKDKYLVSLYDLYFICGTCIAKDKVKGTVSLLTREGVVTVKFAKEYFSFFDKQLSESTEDGKKKIVEKSWFNRGNMIMVQGYRRGDDFVPKKYAKSGGHQLYKITSFDDSGNMTITSERGI